MEGRPCCVVLCLVPSNELSWAGTSGRTAKRGEPQHHTLSGHRLRPCHRLAYRLTLTPSHNPAHPTTGPPSAPRSSPGSRPSSPWLSSMVKAHTRHAQRHTAPPQCLLRLAAGPQNDSGYVELHHMHSRLFWRSGHAAQPQAGRLGHQPRPKSPLAISRRTSSQSTRPSSRTREARATRARTTRTASRPRAASRTRSSPSSCPPSSPTHTSDSPC